MTLALETRGIVKRFPGVVANDGVDFELRAGEVHALLGENGAGKSTLMSILGGIYSPDEGEVLLQGRPVRLRSPRDAIAQGIGMVHQHFMLVRSQTVAENVILGLARPRLLLDMAAAEERVAALGRQYGMEVDPRARVSQLSVGEQQRVELIKVLHRGARIIILDEPTAVLTPREAEGLFRALRLLVAQGHSVIHISHKLDEVLRVADRITVLRRGRVAAAGLPAADTTKAELAERMVGRPVLFSLDRALDRGPQRLGPAALELREVSADNDRGLAALSGISLCIRAGEIYGLAGVAGNGQRELAEVVTGLRPATGGQVLVAGRDLTGAGVRAFLDQGVAHVPEDRAGLGAVLPLSVAENLILKSYRRAPAGGRWLLDRAEVRRQAERMAAEFGITLPSVDVPAGTLSGGNLQRVILARELSLRPRLLVAAHPCRGLDVAAMEMVYRLLLGAREEGTATLLISEDLDELLSLSDRLGVMAGGRLVLSTTPAEASIPEIGLLMGGAQAS